MKCLAPLWPVKVKAACVATIMCYPIYKRRTWCLRVACESPSAVTKVNLANCVKKQWALDGSIRRITTRDLVQIKPLYQ